MTYVQGSRRRSAVRFYWWLMAGLWRSARWLAQSLAHDRPRWSLWLPVALGVGIIAYFSLPVEPPLWPGPLLAAGAGSLAWALRRRAVVWLLIAMVAFAMGFSAAAWRTQQVAAPVLEARIGPVIVEGRVLASEARPDGRRLLLDHLRIDRLGPAGTPERVRITLRGRLGDGPVAGALPGARVSLLATLLPPPPPAAPDAFDFQRIAWFDRIGGVGFALSAPTAAGPADPARPGLVNRLRLALGGLRQTVHGRVTAVVQGSSGTVAAALMMGERGAIPETVLVDMRRSGLAHLLAISGLHMGLVAGFVFLVVRGGLALAPSVALRRPIKKWAAVIALLASLAYLGIAGAPVPTQRAFIMIALVLLAVLADRRALSMRTVALAAVVVMLVAPESVLGPSFQMSFAAVVALIAGYEALRGRGLLFRARGGVGRSVALYMGGVALTSVIAVIATAPFAVANFNQLAVYGLLANMIGVPLTALWIMPLGVMAFLLMPVGLESWALIPMGWGIEALLATAAMIADLPGAVVPLMAPPPWGLGLLVLGALWLCLWRHSWRWLGLPAVVVGAATVFMVTPPDLLVTGDGRLLGVYGSDGRLAVSSLRRERFAAGIWAERSAARATLAFPPPGHPSAGPDGLRCDATACLVRPHGRLVALVSHPAALAEDCATADVVVSLVPVRGRCSGPHTIIDRFDLWRGGAHALWLSDERIRLRSDRDARGWRPWVLLPPAAR